MSKVVLSIVVIICIVSFCASVFADAGSAFRAARKQDPDAPIMKVL